MSDETEGRSGTLSRRLLLQKTMASVGAVAIIVAQPKPTSAAIKISKAAVAYQDHPQDDKRCGKCLQFQVPDGCKMVDGPVSPQGFCRIFMPARQAARPMQTAPTTG
jgi:hypothetical protein